MSDVKREPVDFRYDALNWEFIKAMAQIARYAETKYGSPEQYTKARLTGEKGPLNHIAEHLRAYLAGEEHDHFQTRKHQLAAIAYNASMEFLYEERFGFQGSPLLEVLPEANPPLSPEEVEAFLDRVFNSEPEPENNVSPCEVGPPMTDAEFEIFLTKMRNGEDYDYDYDRAPEAPVAEVIATPEEIGSKMSPVEVEAFLDRVFTGEPEPDPNDFSEAKIEDVLDLTSSTFSTTTLETPTNSILDKLPKALRKFVK